MTMTHETCRERLVDHHYGELAFSDARETAEHLAECAECALEYCRLSAALAGFRELDREAPRPEIQTALREKVVAEFRPTFAQRLARLFSMRVPIYQPALLLLLFFFVWTLMRGVPTATELRTVFERFDGTQVEVVDVHVL